MRVFKEVMIRMTDVQISGRDGKKKKEFVHKLVKIFLAKNNLDMKMEDVDTIVEEVINFAHIKIVSLAKNTKCCFATFRQEPFFPYSPPHGGGEIQNIHP